MVPAMTSAGPAETPRVGRHAKLLVATLVTTSFAGGCWSGHGWFPDLPSTLSALGSLAFYIEMLAAGWPYGLLVLAILGAHEMGHYLACRVYGIPATLPFFIPGLPFIGTFGAVIRIRGRIPDRRALFDVAAAGPIAGFLVALPVAWWGIAAAEPAPPPAGDGSDLLLAEPALFTAIRWITRAPESLLANTWFGAAWVGMLVTSLNLFPVGQLDGGHAAYAVSPRLHRALSWGTIVALAAMMALQWLDGAIPAYLPWLAILVWMRARHPRLESEDGSLGAARVAVALVLVALFVLTFLPLPFVG